MPCDKYLIDSTGKVILENVDNLNGLKPLNDNLTILELSDGAYFINKNTIINLKNYTEKDLKNNPVYKQVASNQKECKGLAARITDLERLNRILKEVKNYQKRL